jgi:hypothetical protein
MSEAPSFLAAAVADAPAPKANPVTIAELRAKVAEARDLQQEKEALEERLKATNIALNSMLRQTLPDLFNEAGTSAIEIEPEGNYPGFSAKAAPYYKAVISSEWPAEKREDAFACLAEEGAEDLIRTEVIVSFPRGHYEHAVEFADAARDAGMSVVVKESVSWQTLTSWLKEQVEKFNRIPPLDRIGGEVGRVVKLKPLKDK